MSPRFQFAVAVALSLAAAACAGPQRPDPAARVDKLKRGDMRYAAVQVEPFTVSPKGVDEKQPELYVRKAQETCVRVLTRSGLFDAVAAGPAADAPQGALLVRAEVQGLKFVSSAKQQWLGGLAGQSHMKVRVALADAATGTVFRFVTVEQDAETAGGPWSFGATDRSLPAEIGTRVAEIAAAAAAQ